MNREIVNKITSAAKAAAEGEVEIGEKANENEVSSADAKAMADGSVQCHPPSQGFGATRVFSGKQQDCLTADNADNADGRGVGGEGITKPNIEHRGEECEAPLPVPVASQARHESVSPQETCASRNVVPTPGARGEGDDCATAGLARVERASAVGLSGVAAAGPADTTALRGIKNEKLKVKNGDEEKNEPPHPPSQECCVGTSVGCYGEEQAGKLKLRTYQEDIFWDEESGIVVLHWSRQIGKSLVLAAWAVNRLITRPGRLVTVLSNSKENGAEFLQKCAEVCRIHGSRFETMVKSPDFDFEDMRMELRIRNCGKIGRIKVLAANPRTARGFSGDLILDEFAFHENGNAIWEAAEPILASNKDFLCRIASTGNGRHNLFYRMVEGDHVVETPNAKIQNPKEKECLTADNADGARMGVKNDECRSPNDECRMTTSGTVSAENSTASGDVNWYLEEVAVAGSGFGFRKVFIQPRPKRERLELKYTEGRNGEGPRIEIVHPPSGGRHQGEPVKNEKLKVKNGEEEFLTADGADGATMGKEEIKKSEAEPNIDHRTSNAEHRMEEKGNPPPDLDGFVVPYYRSKLGFWVSRVTRTMAHGMGLEIYDSQTRESITPERARAQALDKHAYDQNYECSFADENLALLSHELLTAAECDDAGEIFEQDWSASALERLRQSKGQLFAGLDVGRKVDLSVLTVLERSEGMFWVRAML